MISFQDFKAEGDAPLYMQIIEYVKRGIVAGNIVDGDELPSRRMLSALLGINPNTVQKAYRFLEEEGLMASHSGAKSYMLLSEKTVKEVRGQLVENSARSVVEAMRQMGISKEEALELIAKLWEEEDKCEAFL